MKKFFNIISTENVQRFTFKRILTYFIIYSIWGYFAEMLFGLVRDGTIQSRQGFIYGPFCPIYGLGGVIMILGLQYFKKNNYTLFAGGILIGSIVEYLVSLLGEKVLNVTWWDYSAYPLNINGRICLLFSAIWGVLAIYLVRSLHKSVDKLIDKVTNCINIKVLHTTLIITCVFLAIDGLLTIVALKTFVLRTAQNFEIQLTDSETNGIVAKVYANPTIKNLVDKIFNDYKMVKTFPNIYLTDKNGTIYYAKDIYTNITPYYIRLFTPSQHKLTINNTFYKEKALK